MDPEKFSEGSPESHYEAMKNALLDHEVDELNVFDKNNAIVMRLMRELLRLGQSPAEIQDRIRQISETPFPDDVVRAFEEDQRNGEDISLEKARSAIRELAFMLLDRVLRTG